MKTITAKEVIEVFFHLIISRYGCPQRLLSDQGSQFKSKLVKDLCPAYKIEKVETTAYHQQANRKVGRFDQYLVNTLSTVLKTDQSDWDKLINAALFTYRVSVAKTLEETQFFLIYGRDPILPQDLFLPLIKGIKRQVSDTDVVEYKNRQLKVLKTNTRNLMNTRKTSIRRWKLGTIKRIKGFISNQVAWSHQVRI